MLRNRTDIPSYSIWWYININLNLVPGKHHWNLVGKLRSEGLSAPCTWTWCHDLALNLGRCYELYCFFYGKHMKHGSIIHFLGRVCKLPSSHFTMDPSCQRYTGRQSSQEGSGSQCSANEPEVRLFHGRCVWFLCGRVHVFLVGNRCFNRWCWGVGVVCENSSLIQLLILGCSEVTTTLCRVIDMSN